jgi:hypothetical protein
MTKLANMLTAAALVGGLASPVSGQYYPPPTYPPSTYPYQGYPYQNYPGYPYSNQYGYQGNGSVIGQVIDNLLGNRYSVNDRGAVSRCADAAVNEAVRIYRPYLRQGYERYQGYSGGWGYNNIRVTAVTSVERRSSGLRVRGLLDSGLRYGMYNPGIIDPRYAGQGDLTFRCTVDYRGYVSDLRIRRRD